MTDAEYEAQRTDWRSLFVHDPATGRTELIGGATLEDVERRLVNCQRTLAAPPHKATVVLQLVQCKCNLSHSGIRVVLDGEVIDSGEFGGEPEDNLECRDYKWVKVMLAKLAERLGAESRIETVEVDGGSDRDLRANYYTAMAAPYRKPEAKS